MVTTESRSVEIELVKHHAESLRIQKAVKENLEMVRRAEILACTVSILLVIIAIM